MFPPQDDHAEGGRLLAKALTSRHLSLSLLTTPEAQRLRQITEWLQEHQTAVAIVAPVGTARSGLGIRFAPTPLWIAVFVGLLVIFSAAPSLAARVNRLQQGRKASDQSIKRLLRACGHSFGHPGCHVRVNLMKFSEDKKRRRVDTATAFNMEGDPDADLEIDATAGVSGQAFVHRRPAFGASPCPCSQADPIGGYAQAKKPRCAIAL